jgi:hypothetical protein
MPANVLKLGMTPKLASPGEFAAQIAAEYRRWLGVADAANIKVE